MEKWKAVDEPELMLKMEMGLIIEDIITVEKLRYSLQNQPFCYDSPYILISSFQFLYQRLSA